jgi:hypothetical protein
MMVSDYKESGIKRRDFRAVKDKPEAPGALRSKKTHKPIVVLSRVKPEIFDKLLATEHWWISRERRKSNNAWQKYTSYAKPKDAENAIKQWETDPYWGKQYEFKIIDMRVSK